MARGLRSKRERRNRAAIRDKRSAWRREQLDKILNSTDTPAMPAEATTSARQEDEDMAMAGSETTTTTAASTTQEEAMGNEGGAARPYIHFTHSEKRKMKQKMKKVRDPSKRNKLMRKAVKAKLK